MYKVVEIFASIDGEGLRAGELAQFIRLAGCNLRCSYCDTRYAWDDTTDNIKFKRMTTRDILDSLRNDITNVTLTGGEPLAAPEVIELIQALSEAGFRVNIETNGAVDITPFRNVYGHPPMFTIDYKLPSSGMENKMVESNFYNLQPSDVVKFVIGDEADITPMLTLIDRMERHYHVMPHIYVGVVWEQYAASRLVEVMLREPLLHQAVLQLQLHKFIWHPDKRGV